VGGDQSEDRYGIVVALANLTNTLNAADADSAFAAAAQAAATLLRVPTAAVMVRGEGEDLDTRGAFGLDAPDVAERVREAARSSLLSSTPFVASQPAAPGADSPGSSVLSVPMRVGDANVGAVVVLSDDTRAFDQRDVEILHVVASQSALAAWKAKVCRDEKAIPGDDSDLIRHAHRKIQDLSLVNQVSDAVSSTLDLEKLLDIALEQSMAAVVADGGSLMLVNEDTSRLEIVASRGISRKFVKNTSQAVGVSIAGWVAQHGESVLVSNAHTDPRFKMSFYRDDISSSASVPLRVKGGVIGVLNVNTVHENKVFDERDLELLATVANEMAVAIENARLYARVNRRTKQLDSLLQISKTVTATLNLDEVLRRLSDEMCKLFSMDVCAILLVDELSGRLRLGHGVGLKTRRKYAYYDLAAPIAHRVTESSTKVIVRNLGASAALRTDAAGSEGLTTAFGLPLRNQGKLVGVGVGLSRSKQRLPKSQLEIMRPLGELAGVAISNARNYRQKYRIARILQQRLVPSSIPEVPGLEIGHKFLPAREVGGDYYDFIPFGQGKLGVVVADVAGSDVEAAEYTTMGKHVLRTYAREGLSPAQVLTRTNNIICEDTASDLFISLFYGVIDLEKMTLTYANAGCEPPAYCSAATQEVSALQAEGMLLGIGRGAEYSEVELALGHGDVVAAYTDGLTEACVDKRRFGADSVRSIIHAHARRGAQEIADSVHGTLLDFLHGSAKDDMALVVLKVE